MRALVPALVLLLSPLLLPPTQADVGLVRVMAGDRVIEDGEFTFRDYLLVPPGSTLTIRNATVWLDAQRLCTGRTNLPAYRCQPQIDVRGTLVLENATLDTHLWVPDVDAGYILHVERGVVRMHGSELRHYQHVSLVQAGPRPSLIEDTTFREAVGPIRFMQGVDAAFRGNLVEDVREGILVTDAATPIEGNVVRNVTWHLGAPAFHWAIAVTSASPNDHVWTSLAPIRGNAIETATVGIVSQSGVANPIEDNVIRGVRAGMLLGFPQDGTVLDRQPPTVRRNLIDAAGEGIRVSGAAATAGGRETTETLSLRDNALSAIECHAIRVLPMPNTLRVHVDATGIWWGTGEGPTSEESGCAAVRVDDDLSTVDVTPWLRAPPKWSLPLLPTLTRE